jgi:hypothetical protein
VLAAQQEVEQQLDGQMHPQGPIQNQSNDQNQNQGQMPQAGAQQQSYP